MAKTNTTTAMKVLAQLVPFASVCWFKERNLARQSGDYGTSQELKTVYESLVDKDWLLDDNGMVRVEPITNPADTQRAVDERTQQWEAIKAETRVNSAKLLDKEVFEELYVANGKIIAPEYLAISGNRRSTQVFAAKVERRRLNQPIGKELPVMILSGLSGMDRLEIQVMENELKTVGFKDMSNTDRLKAARDCLQLGGNEARLTRIFKRGMAQKLWGIAKLDARWPELAIIDRMCLPATDNRHIGWGVDKEVLRALNLRSEEKTLADHNLREIALGKTALTPATKEELETYFGAPKANGSTKTPMMKRDVVENSSKEFPSLPHRAVYAAVLANNNDVVKPYQLAAKAFNCLQESMDNNTINEIENLLVIIGTVPMTRRVGLIKKLAEMAAAK